MDISSWEITLITAAFGAALFTSGVKGNSSALKFVGVWFIAEALCDPIARRSEFFEDAHHANIQVSYYFFHAITATFFLAISKKYSPLKYSPMIFLSIAFLSVAYGIYRWEIRGDEEFYFSNAGAFINSAYFLMVVALEALLIYSGVKCALANNNSNPHDGVCVKRR